MNMPVLDVQNLAKHFAIRKGLLKREIASVKAVDGVSFSIQPGKTLCIVGESGCGKSTVGRLVMRLIEPSGGTVKLNGEDMTALSPDQFRPYRKRVQMVFQDPSACLNPRLRAGTVVGEPLENFDDMDSQARQARVAALFEKVGLRAEAMQKFPFEFSGGQKQRLGIARALALSPSVIVADEPVSALDVSVQAQVLNLLMDLQDEMGLAYLFISHDLGVVEHIGHTIAVMYLGKIVELAPKKTLFTAPQHPYTRALLSAAPIPDPRAKRERILLEGDVPSPLNPPRGCAFHTRCPFALARCREETPELKTIAAEHVSACHLNDQG